ncbi:hypothetical protein C0583_00125 [Candidatus Parcubacteria bacterium]|nr:MAG: hypothetical protein C0583_00125 [Candidatus Parcubacteria bacterium]
MKKILTIATLVFLFSLTVTPALADGNDTVLNENSAEVMNGSMVMTNTGDNWADGSYGGEGGNGGDIRNGSRSRDYHGEVQLLGPGPMFFDGEDGDVEDSTTGNGGAGGDAAEGGTVITGDAHADLSVRNVVNSNDTEINRCACDEDNDDGNTRVRNINLAFLGSGEFIAANTGSNDAEGSYGGEGGNAGDISNRGEGDVEDSTTGSGARGGAGAAGGLVQSGASTATSALVDRINENVTRIMR